MTPGAQDCFGLLQGRGPPRMANLGKIADDGDPNAAVLPAQVKVFGRSLGILLGPSLLKNSVFHFRRMLPLFGQNNNEEQCPEAEDGKIPRYFSRG